MWRRDVYLACTWPYWLAEISIDLFRWIKLSGWKELYATRDEGLAVRPVITWIKVALAAVLLGCDAYAAVFQVRR